MQIGDLVKHIELEYIGIIVIKDDLDFLCVDWCDNQGFDWYSEWELEVICK